MANERNALNTRRSFDPILGPTVMSLFLPCALLVYWKMHRAVSFATSSSTWSGTRTLAARELAEASTICSQSIMLPFPGLSLGLQPSYPDTSTEADIR
jgi:hypothetical protein